MKKKCPKLTIIFFSKINNLKPQSKSLTWAEVQIHNVKSIQQKYNDLDMKQYDFRDDNNENNDIYNELISTTT